jgi:hypothetical protein
MIDLKTFKEQIDDIVNAQVERDMRAMDATLFEVFYKRSKQSRSAPPLRSLGRLPAKDVIRKFY